ncbi:Chitin synthase, class 2 [Lobulomyces angularis]|nr:Chitin synthase, class 2 [Lobulomyces angularis]
MSNILDKPLESVFGYISVLPGAFSAYRYKALTNNDTLSSGPLNCYFKGESMHNDSGKDDVFSANMYLAEDRILCFELVTKIGENWVLKYVKSAKAETDVPSNLPELVSQRRRWLNGSFFAAVHSITHTHYIFRSGHSLFFKVCFLIQTVYSGNFYLTFYFLFTGTENLKLDPFQGQGGNIFIGLRQVYMAALIIQFVTSFGNRPQGTKVLYYFLVALWAVITIFMYVLGFYSVYMIIPKTSSGWEKIGSLILEPIFRDMVIATCSTYGMYTISSILYMEPWHMITSFVQYMVLLPTYVNTFMIYAFCNLHDISWGTKGDNSAQTLIVEAGSNVKVPAGSDTVEVTLPVDDGIDSNKFYDDMVNELKLEKVKESGKRDKKTKSEDYFKLYHLVEAASI